MNKLNSTAKKIDTFFKIFNILLTIAGVTLVIGLCILAAAFLFDLAPEMVGSGYNSISIGFLELDVAEAYAPDYKLVLLFSAIQCALAFLIFLVARSCVKCVREILRPMIQNEPFNGSVAVNLKKLAKYSLILGIVVNIIQGFTTGLLVGGYDLEKLLISEKITHITFTHNTDFSFLIVWAVFLLLSYVFQYGEELQQLSDETL